MSLPVLLLVMGLGQVVALGGLALALRFQAAPEDAPAPEPVPWGICGLCHQPMPPGEESFMYHGYSGPCPPDRRRGAHS